MSSYKQLTKTQQIIVDSKVVSELDIVRGSAVGKDSAEVNKILMSAVERLSRRLHSRIEISKDAQKILMDVYEKKLEDQKNYYEGIIQKKSALSG